MQRPRPAERDEREVTRVVPRSTETTRRARSISASTTSTIASGARPPRRAPRQPRPAGGLPGASVVAGRGGDSRRSRSVPSPPPVARRPRERGQRCAGRLAARLPRRARRPSRRRRRPCGCRASGHGSGIPRRPGRPSARRDRSRPDRRRSRSSHVERDRVLDPAERGDALGRDHPAAGPDTRASAGWAAASSIVATPPDERITRGRR